MLVTLSQLGEIREKHKGQSIVLGGGCFDLLHQGHIEYFRTIRGLGDIVVIAVKSDAEVRSYKGIGRPIQNEDVRVSIVDAIRYVDYTILAPEPAGLLEHSEEFGMITPPRLIVARRLRPDILVTPNFKWRAYENELRSLGTILRILEVDKVNSTTSIIERIRSSRAP